MSKEEYKRLQARTEIQYEEEKKQSEAMVRSYQRRQAFGIIRSLLGF